MKQFAGVLTSIILTISTILSLIPDIIGAVKTYSPEKDGLKMNCVIVSDTHADADAFRDRTDILRNAFAGISECTADIDALLNIGDITNSGSASEYSNLKRLVDVYLRPSAVVACLGNHDSWNGSENPDYPEAKRLFLDYLGHYGIQSEEVYYSTVIKGYHFICLGTEGADHDEIRPVYSDKQLDWFDSELTKAEKSNLPVFVLCHRPLDGHNGWSGSEVPDRVDEILKAHSSYSKPIIFLSGHWHHFTPDCFERDGNICYLNLPSTEYNDETEYECNDNGGMGFTMELYENEVIFRARNFITDKWVDKYVFSIEF
jgi:3',5'-cyclic AMP phosphodiesterase CpdA